MSKTITWKWLMATRNLDRRVSGSDRVWYSAYIHLDGRDYFSSEFEYLPDADDHLIDLITENGYIVDGYTPPEKGEEEMILDSGERREFESGAVRDMQEGKGRFDLIPYSTFLRIFVDEKNEIQPEELIEEYTHTGDPEFLIEALRNFFDVVLLEEFANLEVYIKYAFKLAKHFEAGAEKYGENNWKKGIPTSSYIDSALRHYFKHYDGQEDEDHATAFVWNILCAIWTCKHRPEFNIYKQDNPSTVEH
ncbi:MAG: hypothetical protein KIH03_01660 [Paludibacteraceae bacterium]|nr:hypothetical protein [Paludibacteraceae bacterium]